MLAEYFDRSAIAAAQAIEGFDEQRFREHLDRTPVGVSGTAGRREGDAMLDLLVRLLARLYPALYIDVPGSQGAQLAELAVAINPQIELIDAPELGIVVGDGAPFAESIFAGSDGWDSLLDTGRPLPAGDSANPFGAGAAACLAAAALFRRVFLDDWPARAEAELRFSTLHGERADAPTGGPDLPAVLAGETVLAGAGAIGHGALWALRRLPTGGTLWVLDPETVELSNMQRYVLAERRHEHAVKAALAAELDATVRIEPHEGDLAAFLSARGHRWPAMLLALDSARDRVGAQASLPAWIANAWTQAGDLGVSDHSPFGGDGACVACQYLPEGPTKNEDELVAEALGVPEQVMEIRTALHTGRPVARPVLEAIAAAVGQQVEALLPFEGRTIRELYVEGFCGGAVIPLGEAGKPHAAAHNVHVPLAHQSALAGVLLAAALIRHTLSGPPEVTRVTRVDVLGPVAALPTQPLRATHQRRCICDDWVFRSVYETKTAT